MRRLGLAFREVGHDYRRNITMTIATILTIAVSLTLFGTGLMVRSQVNAMKDYWYDRVEVSVFLCGKSSDTSICPDGAVTAVQRKAVETKLNTLKPTVEEVYYESSAEAYQRFKEQFRESPILENVTQDSLPESFRVKLQNPEDYQVVANAVVSMPGVETVQDQRKLLDKFFSILGGLQAGALGIAIAMLVVTVLLVANTMRVAAYSRRREIGIMKLVGASNSYIRFPFVLEAVCSAVIGGAIAVVLIGVEKWYLIDQVLKPAFKFTSFITWNTTYMIMIITFLVGVVLSAIAAYFAVRRFLKV